MWVNPFRLLSQNYEQIDAERRRFGGYLNCRVIQSWGEWPSGATIMVFSEYRSYEGMMELEGIGEESKENSTDVLREAGLPWKGRQRFPGPPSFRPFWRPAFQVSWISVWFLLILKIYHLPPHIHICTTYLLIEQVWMDFVPLIRLCAARDWSAHCPLQICPFWHGPALSRVLHCNSTTCIPECGGDLRFICIPQARCGKDPLSTFAEPSMVCTVPLPQTIDVLES